MAGDNISGANFFHPFTLLGIEVFNDGGELFYLACGVWVSSLVLITCGVRSLPDLSGVGEFRETQER